MKSIVKYLREVSVVVIGVAITIGIGLWVNNHNIKKDQQQYLDAIILELKDNAEKFDAYAKGLEKSVGYSNYLNSHDNKSLNKDSIQYYAYGAFGWGNTHPVTLFNEDAFEMFKSSGAMRQVEDKELLLSIWRVYHFMKSAQNLIDGQLQYKKEEALREMQMIDDGKQVVIRLKWFYKNDAPLFMKEICEEMAEFIRETVSELEKSKMVK
jgi:hypothetical protein